MGIVVEIKNPAEDLEQKIKAYKRRFWVRVVLTSLTLLAAIISTFLLIEMQTYRKVRVLQNYSSSEGQKGTYLEYADGMLRYSRDGIVYLDYKGEEQWNQSCQIQSPYAVVNQDAAAVADRGGNTIMVFDTDGIRGEIHTTYPVEGMTIAENGIVCALLKNENTPVLVCYDAAGNVLVEQNASVSGTGYPLSMALAPEGNMLQVNYLCIEDGVQATRVVYYNFSQDREEGNSQKAVETVCKNQVIATSWFVNDSTSVIAGDGAFYVYKGKEKPELSVEIALDKEIRSVFHDKNKIGFVLKNTGEEGYELRIYNTEGRQTFSRTFTGEYSNVKMKKGSVILYEGQRCLVFSKFGVRKFDGELDKSIQEIIPLAGVNKYLLMSTDGIEEVRFVK